MNNSLPSNPTLITVRDNILARAVVLLGQQDRNDLSLRLGDKWQSRRNSGVESN